MLGVTALYYSFSSCVALLPRDVFEWVGSLPLTSFSGGSVCVSGSVWMTVCLFSLRPAASALACAVTERVLDARIARKLPVKMD